MFAGRTVILLVLSCHGSCGFSVSTLKKVDLVGLYINYFVLFQYFTICVLDFASQILPFFNIL